MANTIYTKAKQGLISGLIDLDTATIRAALVRGYTPNLSTHTFVSDVTGAGGTLVSTCRNFTTVTVTDGIFDADNVSFLAVPAGTAIPYILIYQASAVTPSSSVSSTTGTIGTVTSQTATITGMSAVTNLQYGSPLTATAGTGNIGTGTYVTAVLSATSVSVAATSGLTAGTVTNISTTDVADSAKRVIALLDTSTGSVALPITPNGGDIVVQWDNGANRIFAL